MSGDKRYQYDTGELRAVAAALDAKAAALESAHKAAHPAMAAALAEDVKSFTHDGSPAPIYAGTSHLNDAFTAQDAAMSASLTNARATATALRTLADDVEQVERDNKARFDQLSPPTGTLAGAQAPAGDRYESPAGKDPKGGSTTHPGLTNEAVWAQQRAAMGYGDKTLEQLAAEHPPMPPTTTGLSAPGVYIPGLEGPRKP